MTSFSCADVLAGRAPADAPVTLKGWVRTRRDSKAGISFVHVSDGSVYQTEAELGQRLSGGCQRQAPLDAKFMWAFADIGTPVVVL